MRAAPAVIIAASAAGWACWLAAAPALAGAARSQPIVWMEAVTYGAGAIICHQQDARSLHVGGTRMPVCARCFGLYAGGGAGAVLATAWLLVARRRADPALELSLARWRWAAALCGVPTLAAWAAEHAGGLAVAGTARALLAVPLGAAAGAIVTFWAGGAVFGDAAAGTALH